MRKESKDGVPVTSASRKRLSVHAVAWIVCVILCCLSGRTSSAAWVSLGPDGADFRGTVVNPANPAQVTAITVNPNAVYRSSNGGGSWSKIGLISSSSFAEDMSAFSFLRAPDMTLASRCELAEIVCRYKNVGHFIRTSVSFRANDPSSSTTGS